MRYLSKMQSVAVAVVLSVLAAPSFAVAPDLTALTAAVDFSTTITAVLGIMAALAGVYVIMKAGSLVLSRIRK